MIPPVNYDGPEMNRMMHISSSIVPSANNQHMEMMHQVYERQKTKELQDFQQTLQA
jgi:hypothetical protein